MTTALEFHLNVKSYQAESSMIQRTMPKRARTTHREQLLSAPRLILFLDLPIRLLIVTPCDHSTYLIVASVLICNIILLGKLWFD